MSIQTNPYGDSTEIARLTNQIPLLIHCFGGLVPGMLDKHLSGMTGVLDIGCGPGIWMQEFARANPSAHVTGIDTRPTMVHQATNRLREQHSSTSSALLVDSYDTSLPFADESFDLINMQFVSMLLNIKKWASLLMECKRVLRTHGIIRITEFELGQSNAPAQEEWWQLCSQMLKLMDRSPSLSNRHLGWFFELEPMISAAGFQEGKCIPHIVNYSYGAPYHQEWKRDLNLQVRKYLPLMQERGLLTQGPSDSLKLRIEQEMNSPNFHAIQPFLTVLGRKI